jgi:hypothetical protein
MNTESKWWEGIAFHSRGINQKLLQRQTWPCAVGIATRYRLDGLGIESWWGEVFRSRSDLGSIKLPIKWVPGLIPWGKVARAWRWPLPQTSVEVKEVVELYLYVPYEPLWSVTTWTVPSPLKLLLLLQHISVWKTEAIVRRVCFLRGHVQQFQIPNTDGKDNFGRSACWWQSQISHELHRSHDHQFWEEMSMKRVIVDHTGSITSCLQPVEEDVVRISKTIKTQATCQHNLWLYHNNMTKMSIIKIR